MRRALMLLAAAVAAALTGAAVGAVAAAPSKVRAVAFARAVNLVVADVPGYTASSRQTSAPGRILDPAGCKGLQARHHPVASRGSPDFNHEDATGVPVQTVSSKVEVAASSRFAAENLAVARSARFRRCVATLIARSLMVGTPAEIRVGTPVITTAQPSAPGTDGSFAIHLRVRITVIRAGAFSLYFHLLGFRLGPAQVSLLTLGSDSPFPVAEERRLFGLLVGRAVANRL